MTAGERQGVDGYAGGCEWPASTRAEIRSLRGRPLPHSSEQYEYACRAPHLSPPPFPACRSVDHSDRPAALDGQAMGLTSRRHGITGRQLECQEPDGPDQRCAPLSPLMAPPQQKTAPWPITQRATFHTPARLKFHRPRASGLVPLGANHRHGPRLGDRPNRNRSLIQEGFGGFSFAFTCRPARRSGL